MCLFQLLRKLLTMVTIVVEKELGNLIEQRDAFKAKWQAERDVVDTIQKSKEAI